MPGPELATPGVVGPDPMVGQGRLSGALSPRNAFTVDLEDWFQGLTSTNPRIGEWPAFESRVVAATNRLLDLLDAHHVRATFFTLGYVADHHPALIERIRADGHEIAVHGYYHRFVSRLTRDAFAAELDRGIEALYRASGVMPLGHRAPYFSMNARTPWAIDVIHSRGLRYDSSFFPTRTLLYGYAEANRAPHWIGPGGSIAELPVTTFRVRGYNLPVGGGFYLRAWPYWFVRYALRRVRREGLPVIMYLHPWELDLEQPRRRVTARERISHFHGRAGLRGKLERLFADFRFGTLAELLDQIG